MHGIVENGYKNLDENISQAVKEGNYVKLCCLIFENPNIEQSDYHYPVLSEVIDSGNSTLLFSLIQNQKICYEARKKAIKKAILNYNSFPEAITILFQNEQDPELRDYAIKDAQKKCPKLVLH